MTTGASVCPIHVFERNLCTPACLEARAAFRASAHALRQHWHRRRRGEKPMAATTYLVRFGR